MPHIKTKKRNNNPEAKQKNALLPNSNQTAYTQSLKAYSAKIIADKTYKDITVKEL